MFDVASSFRRRPALADFLIVCAVTLAFGWFSIRIELSERVVHWLQLQEHYELDELPGVMLVFAAGLIWFALRRQQELRREIARRQEAEDRLAHLLEENRSMSRRMISMQEDERRNLARELHDELGQFLNAVKVDAVSLQKRLGSHESIPLAAIIANINHVYSVANDMIRRLRPVGLDTLGLAAALEHCVNGWRARLPETSFTLEIAGDFSDLDETRKLAIYRVVQEGLTNIYKHSKAPSVRVSLQRQSGPVDRITLEIVNDGVDSASAHSGYDAASGGFGLIGMRERLLACGGVLEISAGDDKEFRIIAILPASTENQARLTS